MGYPVGKCVSGSEDSHGELLTIRLQPLAQHIHYPGFDRTLNAFGDVAAQSLYVLGRGAGYNKAPLAGICLFTGAAFAYRYCRIASVTLMNAAHTLALLFQRATPRQGKLQCHEYNLHEKPPN